MARRVSFSRADSAVSPVISTILMVAITVVLAATAFVLVADVGGKSTQSGPNIGIRVEMESDQLVVTSAGPGADWNRLHIRLLSDEGTGDIFVGTDPKPYSNKPATTSGGDITIEEVSITEPGASLSIAGGDFLEFCRDPIGTDGAVQVRIIDVVSNSLVGTFNLGGVEACS